MRGSGGSLLAAIAAAAIPLVSAQFPPKPDGLTILHSKFGNGVKISYKEVGTLYQPYSRIENTYHVPLLL
jgi:hypothetical protein